MRSRYSAFTVKDEAYLLRTWDPSTRPARIDLGDDTRWTGLEIVARSGGSALHNTATVTFRAHYIDASGPQTMSERSSFIRRDGEWMYLDGRHFD
jgi:SEC-C motif-containing protein